MKKRHEQKLIILSVAAFAMLNLPFLLIFNHHGHVFGIPTFYLSVFSIWLVVIVVSYVVLKRHYE
ncbi:hypothetical protein BWZ20_02430 [Winogradskyella sp. J14-2]|uniref:hypothetical protein n=1 Tax=Winogradskyella sp. J14-2 TaxID=1936080 RepID=UPI000972C3F6|nr:hypothetical protein [Winogradskyella sp. J14-2]APY07229.1 hypothetical protein BWZ20_02430 [Winogradskyella sp. J14-2]